MSLSKEKEQEYIEKVKRDSKYLKRLTKNQTEKICFEAVKQNGLALKYVHHQTEKICLEAIKQNPKALKLVDKRSPEMCLMALSNRFKHYVYISSPTEEMIAMKKFAESNTLNSYRVIRYKLANREINLSDSPYHVLEQLYDY